MAQELATRKQRATSGRVDGTPDGFVKCFTWNIFDVPNCSDRDVLELFMGPTAAAFVAKVPKGNARSRLINYIMVYIQYARDMGERLRLLQIEVDELNERLKSLESAKSFTAAQSAGVNYLKAEKSASFHIIFGTDEDRARHEAADSLLVGAKDDLRSAKEN